MSAPVFGATDILSLGADWEPIESSGTNNLQHAEATGDDGDVIAESSYGAQQTGTIRYHYIGDEVDFITALVAANALPGQLLASALMVLGVDIDYDPCAVGELPTVGFTLTDGPTAAPATPFWYTSALTLPTYASSNLIIPTLLTVTAGDAECVSCKWGLTCQHGRTANKDGNYLAGQAYKGQETIALSFVGVPTSITSTGWINTQGVSTLIANRSNTGYNNTPYNFVRKVTRTTA